MTTPVAKNQSVSAHIKSQLDTMTMVSVIATLLLSTMATTNLNVTNNQPPSLPHTVDSGFFMEIVRSVHRQYNFQNVVFYISKRLVVDTDVSKQFLYAFWHEFPNRPFMIMIDDEISMNGFLSMPSLCIVLTTGRDDPIMRVTAESLRGARFVKTIFVLLPYVEWEEIYYSPAVQPNKFHKIVNLTYEWIWEKQFLNTILLTADNNVFTLNPYPVMSVVLRKSDNWTANDFFVQYDEDFKGYSIRTPIHLDVPRVFCMTRKLLGARKDYYLSGVAGKMFREFVRFINATFNESDADHMASKPVDMNDILQQVRDSQLEISLHSHTAMTAQTTGTSYPIGINDWCIMVPFRNHFPKHLYLKKSFRDSSWSLICFSVVYITLGIWLCSPATQRDISISFLQSICSIILIVPLRILSTAIPRMRFLYVLLFVMGFFITNLFVSKMASYLTSFTSRQQIDTIADVVNAKLPIMILQFEYEVLKSINYPQEFLDLTVVVSKYALDTHRDRFNTSFGYSVQTDSWNFLNRQQKYLKYPVFHLSSICIGPFYHVFPMQWDSHLSKPLKQFIMFASQFGLMEHWEIEAFGDALFLGYVHMMAAHENPSPLPLEFYRSILIVWLLGIMLSALAFCWEVMGMTWWYKSCLRGVKQLLSES